MKVLKLGTRKSLLAWAQSSWVARKLESQNPSVRIELVGIETQGDRIQDVPLWAINGKEFFVAEIDQALISGGVDLTVHSMKDLSLERPNQIRLGAIPKRENPRDVVLFGPSTLEKLRAGTPIRIGSSSPRRVENIPGFLTKALPNFGKPPQIEMVEIRGNVNTRLERVHLSPDSPKHLDAVVLAFAGLIRLWNDEKGREALTLLLHNIRWMILPLAECPAAPAQGALAIECRAKDSATYDVLRSIHDNDTQKHVHEERQILADWGGGCHQKFGATAVSIPSIKDPLLFIRGKHPNGTSIEDLRWTGAPDLSGSKSIFDGGSLHGEIEIVEIADKLAPLLKAEAVFVAHSNAVTQEIAPLLKSKRLWTSGVTSWFKLAALGLWVEGCGDGFGFDWTKQISTEPVLGLPQERAWVALTHQNALAGWVQATALPTYKVNLEVDPARLSELRERIRGSEVIYWSSSTQFDQLGAFASENAVHCCGPGKTALHLTKVMTGKDKSVVVFPSHKEWEKWVSKRN